MELKYKDSEKWLADNGYQKHPRYTYDKYGGIYVHKETGQKADVTHYPKAGRTHVDKLDNDGKIVETFIANKLIDYIVEGTAGDTNLIDEKGQLTHRGYAAMYAWKKAGHKGLHPSIKLERKAKGIHKVVTLP